MLISISARIARCPYGIYELVATPGSEATSSTQTYVLPSGRRTYAPILRRADVSVNLQMYFATRDNEPVALTALEAGGGGDCLFHSIAAIADRINRVDGWIGSRLFPLI